MTPPSAYPSTFRERKVHNTTAVHRKVRGAERKANSNTRDEQKSFSQSSVKWATEAVNHTRSHGDDGDDDGVVDGDDGG